MEIKPYTLVYDLRLDSKQNVAFRSEPATSASNSKWTETVVNIPDIVRYFEFVSRMQKDKKLAPPPVAVEYDGELCNFKPADYCSLGTACCGKCPKVGFDVWVAQATANCVRVGLDSPSK